MKQLFWNNLLGAATEFSATVLNSELLISFDRTNGKNVFSASGSSASGRKIKTAVRRRK